jgi:hypothetical protein
VGQEERLSDASDVEDGGLSDGPDNEGGGVTGGSDSEDGEEDEEELRLLDVGLEAAVAAGRGVPPLAGDMEADVSTPISTAQVPPGFPVWRIL